jgi:hypothetical protein
MRMEVTERTALNLVYNSICALGAHVVYHDVRAEFGIHVCIGASQAATSTRYNNRLPIETNWGVALFIGGRFCGFKSGLPSE